jgi:hypothetical protein
MSANAAVIATGWCYWCRRGLLLLLETLSILRCLNSCGSRRESLCYASAGGHDDRINGTLYDGWGDESLRVHVTTARTQQLDEASDRQHLRSSALQPQVIAYYVRVTHSHLRSAGRAADESADRLGIVSGNQTLRSEPAVRIRCLSTRES